jgi:hypothetical protein
MSDMEVYNNDDADDDGVVADFCACFHLSKKAVWRPLQPTGMQAERDSAQAASH